MVGHRLLEKADPAYISDFLSAMPTRDSLQRARTIPLE
jgi:hypothetical protein